MGPKYVYKAMFNKISMPFSPREVLPNDNLQHVNCWSKKDA